MVLRGRLRSSFLDAPNWVEGVEKREEQDVEKEVEVLRRDMVYVENAGGKCNVVEGTQSERGHGRQAHRQTIRQTNRQIHGQTERPAENKRKVVIHKKKKLNIITFSFFLQLNERNIA